MGCHVVANLPRLLSDHAVASPTKCNEGREHVHFAVCHGVLQAMFDVKMCYYEGDKGHWHGVIRQRHGACQQGHGAVVGPYSASQVCYAGPRDGWQGRCLLEDFDTTVTVCTPGNMLDVR